MPLSLDRAGDLMVALLPELVLTVWAMLLLVLAAWRHRDPGIQRQVGWLSLVGVFGAMAIVIRLWVMGVSTTGPTDIIAVDAFRWAVTLIVLTGVALTTVLAIGYLDRENINVPEYHVLVLLAAVGMLFMASGAELLVIFLGLETMSVCVYVLAGINRRSPFSAEAALKYFLLGAFASAFLLYGIALLYGATGTTRLALVGFQSRAGLPGTHVMLQAGIAMLIVGFGFKIAAVPFHMWAPDVYDGAPTPATALMAATVKTAAFGALVRVLLVGLIGAHADWSVVLWWLAAVTMIGGNLLALAQRSLKRMLAYSSIAHAGYVLAGLIAGSPAGAAAYLFYLMFYTLATIAAFAVVVAMGRGEGRDVSLDDLAGLAESDPLLAVIMALSMLSLMGFPGTAGFVGKWYVLLAATGGGYTGIAVLLVVTSVVSAGYYLPVIMSMYMRPRAHDRAHAGVVLPDVVRASLVLAVGAVLAFGIFPGGALRAAGRGMAPFMQRLTTATSQQLPSQPLPPGHPGASNLPPGHPGQTTPPGGSRLPPGHPGPIPR